MNSFSFLVILSCIGWSQIVLASSGRTVRDVTYGSVFKLVNLAYQVRLHSHDIKYGSGSGQQSVTGVETTDDVNSHWLVKGTTTSGYKRGEPVPCGSKVRLEHPPSSKNLHSHHFGAPLTNDFQEISAYGQNGEGDSGDVWQVVCRGSSRTWKRDESVELKHIDTDVYLGLSGRTFGRPINGQFEVVGISRSSESSRWTTGEGIFVHPTESAKHHSHTEL